MTYRIIDALSFNSNIRDLADSLSRKVELSEDATPDLISHPGGFTRAFRKRRMGIAESYIRIARELDRNNHCKRLHALKTLVELSFHAKTVSLPLNTARVQIEIMKEAVKNLENPRKQMEMIADFSLVSHGHEAVIREFLRKLRRVRVPEEGKALRDLDMGWDSHVHDNLSEGRKNPSQLVLDAFIKGMSRVTVAYYDISDRDIIFELMEAGRILGVDVSVGVEFSTGPARSRKHFMYLPPAKRVSEFFSFFDRHRETLSEFITGLEENRKRRQETITTILENFNRTHRVRLNEGYPEDCIFSLRPIRVEDLEKRVPHGQYSRNHLGELICSAFKSVLRHRVLALKVQYEVSGQLFERGEMSDWELERIHAACHAVRAQYTSLTPDDIRLAYLSEKNIMDYDSAFPSEAAILPSLSAAGGQVVYHCPLEQGLAGAISTVIRAHPYVDKIELINMRDSAMRNPSEIIGLSRFVNLVNNCGLAELRKFTEDCSPEVADEAILSKALDRYHEMPLIPLAGSASTGRKPYVPGMGFIRESDIPLLSRKHFIRSHYRLPSPVSGLITTEGKGPPRGAKATRPEYEIFSLGQSGSFKPNLIGDEEIIEPIGPARMWRYLNPGLKNILRVLIGLIPAYLWIGPVFTLIWFGITFFRNVFADLIALSGRRLGAWSYRNINFDNATQSLFWTGFSVPILGLVKQGFDLAWPLAHAGPVFECSKFFAICIANGVYIASHNKIRNFDHRVILVNFFRSILAWPFASLFSPIGNLLMIPSIVQAKFWSDVVAAVIEGGGKYRQEIVLRTRDLKEILPLLSAGDKSVRLTAMLDILYIWARRRRGRTALLRLLCPHRKERESESPGETDAPELASDEIRHSHATMSDELVQLFNPHHSEAELSRFILRKYSKHEVLILMELLSANLVSFHRWLKKIRKRYAKKTGW